MDNRGSSLRGRLTKNRETVRKRAKLLGKSQNK